VLNIVRHYYQGEIKIIQRLCTLMKIGNKKRRGGDIIVSRCEVDYPAISTLMKIGYKKGEGTFSIKV
jgi:hypothetical protein